ncbi:MAG TPA: hypothetical protein DIU15_15965, partial [Deltaproteobacteria bacterium]|nr:hypothetical protein [Deltaproteobacteria bacterium]
MEQEPSSAPEILFLRWVPGLKVIVALLAVLPFLVLLHAPLLVDERVLFFEARKWIGLDPLAPFSLPLGGSGTWRPLLLYVYWLDSGSPTWLSHLLNLALHAGLSVLVFVWLERRLSTSGAFLGACFFAVHGSHVATAGWVAGRADLAMVTCVVLALLALDRGRWLLCSLSCAAAVLFKETAVVVPLLLFLASRWPSGVETATRSQGRALCLSGATVAIAFAVTISIAEVSPGYWPGTENVLTGLAMLAVPYLLEVLVPWFRPLAVPWSLPDLVGMVFAVPVASVFVWAAWRSRDETMRLGLVFCVLGMAPVIHVLGNDGGQWYLLLPSLGASLVWGSWAKTRTKQGIAVVLVTATLGCTVVEASRWRGAADQIGQIISEAQVVAQELGADALEQPPAQDPRSWPHVGPSFCCG